MAFKGLNQDQTLIDPNPEPTTSLPNASPFLGQDSLEEKAEAQARGGSLETGGGWH